MPLFPPLCPKITSSRRRNGSCRLGNVYIIEIFSWYLVIAGFESRNHHCFCFL